MDAALFFSNISIAMGGMMFSMLIGHLIFIDSKDIIWVYKRSPRGVSGLIYSYIIAIFILIVIMAIPITILFVYVFKFNMGMGIYLYISFSLYSLISLCQSIAVQCFSPAFEEKGRNMQGNVMISMILQNIPLFAAIFMLIGSFFTVAPEFEWILVTGILFLINGVISIPMLYFGLKKLKQIE